MTAAWSSSSMLSAAYKEAIPISVSFVASLFPVFDDIILWNGNGFCIFIVRVTLIKIANRYTIL